MGKATPRRTFLGTAGIAALAVAGCSSDGGNQNAHSSGGKLTDTVQPATPAKEKTYGRCGVAPVNYPHVSRYSPVRAYTQPRVDDTTTHWLHGDSVKHNVADTLVQNHLGIRWNADFIYSGDTEYQQKLSLMLVSGNVPDYFEVTPLETYSRMVSAGLLKDITDIWPKVASPHYKKLLSWNNNSLWKPITIKGRIYGLPRVKIVGQDEMLLWYRKDWLRRVGGQPPTTIDQIHTLAQKFTKAKLAPHAATIGLPLTQAIDTWVCSADPIFGGYGAMPGIWKKQGARLVYSSILPEVKAPLQVLANWYREGLIQQDFYTMDETHAETLIINGQVGMFFGPSWCPSYPLPDATKNATGSTDPATIWDYVRVPVGPGGRRGVAYTPPVVGAEAFSAKLADADVAAIVNNLNWVDYLTTDPLDTHWHGFAGYDYVLEHGCQARPGPTLAASDQPLSIPPVAKNPDVLWYKHNFEQQDALVRRYRTSPNTLDSLDRYYAKQYMHPAGSAQLQRKAYDESLNAVNTYAVRSAFNGIPGPVYAAKFGQLADLEKSWYTNFIVGKKSIADFDEFVRAWQAEGGTDVTDEINSIAAGKR